MTTEAPAPSVENYATALHGAGNEKWNEFRFDLSKHASKEVATARGLLLEGRTVMAWHVLDKLHNTFELPRCSICAAPAEGHVTEHTEEEKEGKRLDPTLDKLHGWVEEMYETLEARNGSPQEFDLLFELADHFDIERVDDADGVVTGEVVDD